MHGDLKGVSFLDYTTIQNSPKNPQDNILIDKHLEPRLADFGLSKLMTEFSSDAVTVDLTSTFAGSLRWMARELFTSSEANPTVTCESDVWAFSMTVVVSVSMSVFLPVKVSRIYQELFTSNHPYNELKNEVQVILAVHKGILPMRPEPSCGINDDIWELCNDCWRKNPALRPSMQAITKRLWELDLKYVYSDIFSNFHLS